jgi:hypothetical protein
MQPDVPPDATDTLSLPLALATVVTAGKKERSTESF